jgi:hypothetical protein
VRGNVRCVCPLLLPNRAGFEVSISFVTHSVGWGGPLCVKSKRVFSVPVRLYFGLSPGWESPYP